MRDFCHAFGVYSLAFLGGGLGAALLIGTGFHLLINGSWLREWSALSAVASTVTGFYLSYRAALSIRAWIFNRLDNRRYGLGLMLIHLSMFIFMGGLGWRIVLNTWLLRLSPEMPIGQAIARWEDYDWWLLRDWQVDTLGQRSHESVFERNKEVQRRWAFVAPLVAAGGGGDTLWLGYTARDERETVPPWSRSDWQPAFFRKVPWAERSLYQQTLGIGDKQIRIVESQSQSPEEHRWLAYRWIAPYIGFNFGFWLLGVALASALRREYWRASGGDE